jgi:hypothetical protein
MKLIPLTKGYSAKVDDWWFDELNMHKWHFSQGYARRHIYTHENGKRKQQHIFMHQAVAGRKFVDHHNGDTLDYQEANLRPANHSTNAMNMRKHKGSSIYKGVVKTPWGWRTQIWKDNSKVYDASFPNERWAGMAYDLNAPALFGEYARLNFPNAIFVVRE